MTEYRAIHPTTLVPESAFASYLGHQPGEVAVLEVTLANTDPTLWMVTYSLQNEEKPGVYWEYIYPDDLGPFLDEELTT